MADPVPARRFPITTVQLIGLGAVQENAICHLGTDDKRGFRLWGGLLVRGDAGASRIDALVRPIKEETNFGLPPISAVRRGCREGQLRVRTRLQAGPGRGSRPGLHRASSLVGFRICRWMRHPRGRDLARTPCVRMLPARATTTVTRFCSAAPTARPRSSVTYAPPPGLPQPAAQVGAR
jgi:hypothetical protein